MSRSTGSYIAVVAQRHTVPAMTFPGFVQPETAAATIGGAPNGPVPVGASPQISQFNQSKNKGEPGYKLPEATCVWVTPPPGTQTQPGSRFYLPLLNRVIGLAAEANLNVPGAVSLADGTGTVVGITGEDIN